MSAIDEAIKRSKAEVQMVKVAPGAYVVQVYSGKLGGWMTSVSMPYRDAVQRLTQSRHEAALKSLGWPGMDAWYEAQDKTGRLIDRVKESLRNE